LIASTTIKKKTETSPKNLSMLFMTFLKINHNPCYMDFLIVLRYLVSSRPTPIPISFLPFSDSHQLIVVIGRVSISVLLMLTWVNRHAIWCEFVHLYVRNSELKVPPFPIFGPKLKGQHRLSHLTQRKPYTKKKKLNLWLLNPRSTTSHY